MKENNEPSLRCIATADAMSQFQSSHASYYITSLLLLFRQANMFGPHDKRGLGVPLECQSGCWIQWTKMTPYLSKRN